jgi:hypothetical protein
MKLEEQFIIRKPGTSYSCYEDYSYLVEEEGKYLWGKKEDAVIFNIDEAKKQQNMLAFETKLEGV